MYIFFKGHISAFFKIAISNAIYLLKTFTKKTNEK